MEYMHGGETQVQVHCTFSSKRRRGEKKARLGRVLFSASPVQCFFRQEGGEEAWYIYRDALLF